MSLGDFERELRAWVAPLGSVLELGAGNGHWSGFMPYGVRYRGIDLDPTNGVLWGDMANPETWPAEVFDGVLLVDTIEHLWKTDALWLLGELDRRFEAVGVFTPIGFMPQDHGRRHPQTHRSGWLPEEFLAKGFCVVEWPKYHVRDGATYGAQWAWRHHR